MPGTRRWNLTQIVSWGLHVDPKFYSVSKVCYWKLLWKIIFQYIWKNYMTGIHNFPPPRFPGLSLLPIPGDDHFYCFLEKEPFSIACNEPRSLNRPGHLDTRFDISVDRVNGSVGISLFCCINCKDCSLIIGRLTECEIHVFQCPVTMFIFIWWQSIPLWMRIIRFLIFSCFLFQNPYTLFVHISVLCTLVLGPCWSPKQNHFMFCPIGSARWLEFLAGLWQPGHFARRQKRSLGILECWADVMAPPVLPAVLRGRSQQVRTWATELHLLCFIPGWEGGCDGCFVSALLSLHYCIYLIKYLWHPLKSYLNWYMDIGCVVS